MISIVYLLGTSVNILSSPLVVIYLIWSKPIILFILNIMIKKAVVA